MNLQILFDDFSVIIRMALCLSLIRTGYITKHLT
jgi:hypothetical protein